MKDIVIVGAGGFARDVLFLLQRINHENPTYNIIGFIDEQLDTGSIINGVPVIGNNDFLIRYPKELAVAIAIGNGKIRKRLYNLFKDNSNLYFPNLIDPSVIRSEHITFGIGNIIYIGTILTINIQIENFVILNVSCNVGHDSILESYVTVSPSTNISGNVHIESLCYLGTSSSIIQGIHIGGNSTIGAGAVVIRDIPKNCTAVGIPAKPIKFL